MVNNMIKTIARRCTLSKIAAVLMTSALAGALTSCGGDCITTREQGCLVPEQFTKRANALAEEYRAHTGFASQWGLTSIRAHQGYAHLALAKGADVQPGEGVTVGIIDTGIDHTHPWFDGKNVTEEFLLEASDESGDKFSHGTAVAGVIGAIRNDRFPLTAHGVAWGADLAVFAIPLGSGAGRPYSPILLKELAYLDVEDASLYRHVLDWRNLDETIFDTQDASRPIDFVNLSFGYEGIIEAYTEQELREHYSQTIAALAQENSNEKTIFVWAAGNGNADDCSFGPPHCVEEKVVASSVELLAGLPARIEELRGHMIAVVAVDVNGKIADFSNRCGIAADWCLAAPGEDVRIAYFGPNFDNGEPGYQNFARTSGTSFSAPMVTGGLAVLKHLFRDQVPNTELAARLLATADRGGRYADRDIYGQGLMDLGAATAPVSAPRITLGNSLDGEGADLRTTHVELGDALGDGFRHALTGQEIVAFDALGAPFWFNLSEFASVSTVPSLSARLRGFMAPAPEMHGVGTLLSNFARWSKDPSHDQHPRPERLQLGFLRTPAGVGSGHLGLAEHALTASLGGRDALQATVFSTQGMYGLTPTLGGELSWWPSGARTGIRAGWLNEREGLLGSSAHGAFGGLSANVTFVGFKGETELGGWRLAGGAEFGATSASPHDGLIASLSPLTTSAFTLLATRLLTESNGLQLSITQPLRVEAGRAVLSVPVGRTKSASVAHRSVAADLTPTGRQIDISAHWHWRMATGGEVRLGAEWTHQPGHRAAADPGLALFAGWRKTW